MGHTVLWFLDMFKKMFHVVPYASDTHTISKGQMLFRPLFYSTLADPPGFTRVK